MRRIVHVVTRQILWSASRVITKLFLVQFPYTFRYVGTVVTNVVSVHSKDVQSFRFTWQLFHYCPSFVCLKYKTQPVQHIQPIYLFTGHQSTNYSTEVLHVSIYSSVIPNSYNRCMYQTLHFLNYPKFTPQFGGIVLKLIESWILSTLDNLWTDLYSDHNLKGDRIERKS